MMHINGICLVMYIFGNQLVRAVPNIFSAYVLVISLMELCITLFLVKGACVT